MSHNSLLDDLLDDLNESDKEEVETTPITTNLNDLLEQELQEQNAEDIEMGEGGDYLPSGGVKPTQALDSEIVNEMVLGEISDIMKVAKLFGSKNMNEVLTKIDYYSANPDPDLASDEESLEYRLIVQANNLSVEIDNEMLIVHKFIRDHYIARFPELDSLVSSPLPFCQVILALGNGESLSGSIEGIIPSGAVMAVHVTAATTKGEPLEEKEWRVIEGACQTMFGLNDAKAKILSYVESRISILAPNISAIVGTTTATKILGIAGGLHGLSRIPHSNIYVLGQVRRTLTGFSTGFHSAERLHTGFIYQCPLVQSTRQEDRMKAQRKIGAKVALAVRVDIAGTRPDGGFGEEMMEKLRRELDRLSEPNPSKLTKALPRPDEQKKAKRGGKRARKAKEANSMTDLRKQQNRMAFGQAEEEVGAYDETRGLGMIGASSGKVRANVGEIRSKAKMSKRNTERIAAFRSQSSGTATSGLASSLSFTPSQGMELVDPNQARKIKLEQANGADSKWFGNNSDGTFTHVKKGGGFGKPSV